MTLAFTGALSKGKIGLFEAASGGTIFLDEIGEMPLTLQSKLLRALENHEIRRVGGVKNIPIDARIICATNARLQDMIKEKTFREDLYYRLSVFTLNLPPLRDRKEDIIPLAEVFLKKLNQKYGTDKIFADISIDTMKRHNWPGNIRELRNVVERIFVVSKGRELIFTPTPTADLEQIPGETSPLVNVGEYGSLKEYMDEMERLYIAQVMDECNGSVNETAKRLGIHRSVLYRKTHKEKL
ncbi:MAG: sigma 54-interacting transcriptional regulator [Firmicutes bacterium]|nr:sigma 54-interacting transcriptional regulator [Bacillota bacterium]